MTVKSLFVPSYALQGEDIPGHIIWDKFSFNHIEIELPKGVAKKHLYNVREEMVETSGNNIVIRKTAIEVDGYLGMLFSSKKIKDEAVKSRITFTFKGMKNSTLLKRVKEIYLFRPQLELDDPPRDIKIDPEKGFVYNRIRARKNNEGTIFLKIRSTRSSEVQIRTPNSVVEYRKRLVRNLQDEYAELRREYPQYSGLMNKHTSMIRRGWKSQKDLERLREISADIHRIGLESEEFSEKFFVAMLNGLWRSQRFLSLPDTLLRYVESVTHKKIWLARPENTIEVSPEPKILRMELMPSDILLKPFATMKLRDINIVGTEKGEIEVAKLFDWT